MIGQIFVAIELVLKLIGLWDQFTEYVRLKSIADREERRQDRDKAVDNQQSAKTEDEFDKAQDDISRNLPRP